MLWVRCITLCGLLFSVPALGAQDLSMGAFYGSQYHESVSSAAEFKPEAEQGLGSRGAFISYSKGDWQALIEYSNYTQSSSRSSLSVLVETEQWALRGRYNLLQYGGLFLLVGLAAGWLDQDYRAHYQNTSISRALENQEFLGADLGVQWRWKRLYLGVFTDLSYNLPRKETFTAVKVSGGVLLHQW